MDFNVYDLLWTVLKIKVIIIISVIIYQFLLRKFSKSRPENLGFLIQSWPILGHLSLGSTKWLPEKTPLTVRHQQNVFGFQCLFPKEPLIKLMITVVPLTLLLKAEAAEVLLSSNKQITKSKEYRFFESWLGSGLLTSTGAKWKKRRRMLTSSFHFRVLNQFHSIINDHSLALVDHLKKQVDKECIDILHFVTMCALDVICETIMGVNIDTQNNNNSEYVQSLHHMSKIGIERRVKLHHWNNFIFNLLPTGKLYNASLKTVHDFTKKIIKRRINERLSKTPQEDLYLKKGLPFLDLLVDEHFKNPSFTESDIQEEVDTFMFEGHDTAAIGLSWCIYLLGLHPDIQERAFEEVTRVLGQDKQVRVTEKELKELKYLECVIKESQRMFPSVPFIGRKLEEDLNICGRLVPKGSNCFVAIAVIHRDPDLYPEPNKFDPDRFTIENTSGRHPYGYIPFSAGPRNCIGQKFALNEEKTIMAHLIRNFTWKSLDPLDKVTFAPNMVSRPIPGHRIKLFKRD